MKHIILVPLCLTILSPLLAEEVTTIDGQVLTTTSLRRNGTTLLIKIPGSSAGGSVEMGLPLARIARVNFVEPPELAKAEEAAKSANAARVLELTGPYVSTQGDFKDLPGSWWPEMAKLRLLALAASGKDAETADLARQTGLLKTPEADSLARGGTLYSSLISGDSQAVIVGARALPTVGGTIGSPLAQLALGRVLLAKKDYKGAIRAFLAIKVFYPAAALLQPAALAGAAQCYTGMKDEKRASSTHSEITTDWPLSPQAAASDSKKTPSPTPYP
jgi:hypothetical protein